ncbi:MAG: hypothetical protein CL504_04730 [Actinobacteria bacterium]|nr:hypothetical protein [Actinomycetota bacterium]
MIYNGFSTGKQGAKAKVAQLNAMMMSSLHGFKVPLFIGNSRADMKMFPADRSSTLFQKVFAPKKT